MSKKRGNSFERPEVRKKAIETRLANPHGRRQAIYKDIPNPFAEVDTLGRPVAKKEREAKERKATEIAVERTEALVNDYFDTVAVVLTKIRDRAVAGKALSLPDQSFLGKFMDKLLPDLRSEAKGNSSGKVTKIIIGGQLIGAMSNGTQGQFAIGVQQEDVSGE